VAEEHHRPHLRVSAVVPMMHRHTQLAGAVRERLEAYFPGRVTPPLGVNVAIDEAQSHGQTVWGDAPRSKGAARMSEVAEAGGRGSHRGGEAPPQLPVPELPPDFFRSSSSIRRSSSESRWVSWARSAPRAGRFPTTFSTSDFTRSSARRCRSSKVRWPARRRS